MIERKGKLVGKVVLISVICAAIVASCVAIIGIYELRTTYMGMTEEELHVSATQAESEFSMMWDGDWAYDDAVLTKGGEPVYDEYIETIEKLKSETNLEYTIFYGDTRAVTSIKSQDTGEYVVGTTASAAVVDQVIGKSQDMYSTNLNIEGGKYYGYYTPIYNTDGSTVGMMFVGRESSDILRSINRVIMTMVTVLLIGVVLLIILGMLGASAAGKTMKRVADGVSILASGDLTYHMPDELIVRKDEIGIISDAIQNLGEKLREVLGTARGLSGNVSDSGEELSLNAQNASSASSQVTDAVDDISKGAVSQAESVQDSVNNVSDIGVDIENISSNVVTLMDYAKEMNEACVTSMKTLDQLLQQNQGVVDSMAEIDSDIRNTNEAVNNISTSTQLITDIASQTNLLALNASIEAARAGEAGKGFAVVAEEIGKLADQSGETASEINDIVAKLTQESEKSVATIARLNDELAEQSKQLDDTQQEMKHMERGVNSVTESAAHISAKIDELQTAKNNLMDLIGDLSAISQENAASTEETNASMEELNATFEVINQSAEDLKHLAIELDKEISFFKL
ncbi:MAG: methyl-accepting chemotaxis protein [Pseudobutyrivibrio sp.]|nr:methyl-accepting chemotaxis protein [Pseudobutyrivibrio sp.]